MSRRKEQPQPVVPKPPAEVPLVSCELPDDVYGGLLALHVERGGKEPIPVMIARVLRLYIADPAFYDVEFDEAPIKLDPTTLRCIAAMGEITAALERRSGELVLTGLTQFTDDAGATSQGEARRTLTIGITQMRASK